MEDAHYVPVACGQLPRELEGCKLFWDADSQHLHSAETGGRSKFSFGKAVQQKEQRCVRKVCLQSHENHALYGDGDSSQ